MKSWAVPAAIIVAVEYLFALTVGERVGFRYSIPFATYFITGLTIVGICGAITIAARLSQRRLPICFLCILRRLTRGQSVADM